MMLYKVPMPTRANGVKIVKIGDHQIGIEYQTGEPHVGKMAYDSQCGILSKNIEFRRPRQYYADIVADAVRKVDAQDAMPKAGKPRSLDVSNPRSAEEYDSDNSTYSDHQEVAGKVISYLKDLISPDDLEAVNGLLMGGESDDGHEGRRQATDRGLDRREQARLAADQAARNYRRLCARDAEATDAEFLKLFPNANRLLQR